MHPTDVLRTRLGTGLRIALGGEETPRDLPEDSHFGPDSAMWDVHGDPAVVIGAIRALVLQTLHPPTMAGVADHSAYTDDPLGRLQRTGQFVGITTYGTMAEIEQAVAMLHVIHERVRGVAPDGTPYHANDPHLLGWVHATEVDSFLTARRTFGVSPLAEGVADRYVAEMAEIAGLLGVEKPPGDTGALATTIRSYRSELGVNHQTREGLRFLLFPPMPLAYRGPYGVLLAGAVSTLPVWARRKLWLPPLPLTERLAVRPAAQAITRVVGWALAAPGPEAAPAEPAAR